MRKSVKDLPRDRFLSERQPLHASAPIAPTVPLPSRSRGLPPWLS